MALKFQYNKIALQEIERAIKIRVAALPTIRSKESALRFEIKKLTAKLETSEHKNQSLMLLTPAMLGLGIAIGAALGIGSVMLFCYINQKKGAQ